MKCPKCQAENPEVKKFCTECGTKLSKTLPEVQWRSPSCRQILRRMRPALAVPSKATPKELSFDEKLAKIQKYLPGGLTEKILAQRGKIEGERKQVTVMFTDMEGFTPLVEKLGPRKLTP